MTNVTGALFAFDLLVAVVLAFVYFNNRSAVAKAKVQPESEAIDALVTEVSKIRHACGVYEGRINEMRAQLNDLNLEKGLGRRGG